MTSRPSRLELERELLWRRYESNMWAFILECVEVKNPRGAYEPWNPDWEHQADIAVWMQSKIESESRSKSGALKARQIGWTTIAHAAVLWDIFFTKNHDWLSVSVGEDEAKDALTGKIKEPYERLPRWMRIRGPKVVTSTAEVFALDNGSSVRAIPSTERSGRSRAVFGALFDEAAFMQDAGSTFAAVEPTVYGPMFVFSTANGMGDFFHDTWVESLASDTMWDMRFFPWSVVPGRDEKWYEETKLTYRTQPHLFYQEYPSNPTEAFLKSGRTAFDLELLEDSMPWRDPLVKLDVAAMLFHQHNDDWWELSEIPDGGSADLELWVFEFPEVERLEDGSVLRKPNYAIGCDVAEGLAHGDFSAISVRDVHDNRQVATLQAHVPVYDLGVVLAMLGYAYFEALIGVERNGPGLVPLEYLRRIGYPRLYRMDPIAELARGHKDPRYGWLTSSTTKPKMVQDMVKGVVHGDVILHDRRWLQEASTFVSNGRGGYEASASNTDDLMMAELIVHQVSQSMERFPFSWVDPVAQPLTFGDVFNRMSYADSEPTDDELLNRPIGQPHQDPMSRSFVSK